MSEILSEQEKTFIRPLWDALWNRAAIHHWIAFLDEFKMVIPYEDTVACVQIEDTVAKEVDKLQGLITKARVAEIAAHLDGLYALEMKKNPTSKMLMIMQNHK